jgi:hypothetical protein
LQDYKLAVRTTNNTDNSLRKYINTLISITKGEIDVQHVGNIEVLPPPTLSPRALGILLWRTPLRPLVPGSSVAHFRSTAGTIGAFVKTGDGAICILSNNHVLAFCNAAALGDQILQPGPSDGGQPQKHTIAKLKTFVRLSPFGNSVDCALGELIPGNHFDTMCAGRRPGGLAPATLGASAWKVGRTTGVTLGKVSALGLDDVPVRIGSNIVYFDNQIEITGDSSLFSDGGDSGSLIMTANGNHPFGLLFAGSNTTGKTYANNLDLVLRQTNSTLLILGTHHEHHFRKSKHR